MKKEFSVLRIQALQKGNHYIYITYNDASEYKLGER